MHVVYLVSVWLHILAATVWIGGMGFIVLVVVPWLRRGGGNAGAFLRETGVRFRAVGWVCFAILLVTGSYNLWARGVRPGSFLDPDWLTSPFGKTLLVKLAAFAVVLVVSAVHDFGVGPRATVAIERDPRSPEAEALRKRASKLGRANAILALVLVAAAVMLVRGTPW
jgi:copper resistance protein D